MQVTSSKMNANSFGAGCQLVACPTPGAITCLIITGGGHALHGLDGKQPNTSIFFKS